MADGLSHLGIAATAEDPESFGPADPSPLAKSDLSEGEVRIHQTNPILNRPALRFVMKTADIAAAFLMTSIALYTSSLHWLDSAVGVVLPFALIPVVINLGLRNTDTYRLAYSRPVIDHMIRTALGAGLPLTALVVLVALFHHFGLWRTVLGAAYLSLAAVLVLHAHFIVAFKVLTRNGAFSENVVLVGATPNAHRLLERNDQTRQLNVVAVFDDRLSRAPETLHSVPVLGRIDDLLNWDRLPDIDRVIVTVTSDARTRVRTLVDRLRVLPQRVVLLLDLEGFDPETESLAEIARSPAAYVSGSPNDLRRTVIKRISDVVFASLMLIVFSPLLALTALAIKLESKGPVFFRQKRHGFNNQIIRVWKFRSMRDDPEAAEMMASQTVHHDPRVTRVGKVIRAMSIDELPQLLNVLSGEMSLVGPRPHAVGMTAEDAEVQSFVSDYAHRHRVKPGITGWAQINGSRGPVHTGEGVRERIRLDMEYVNRASFWFDMFVMLATAPCLLGDWTRQR
ncbi:MAG: exopolysaccharide biosynthesis polyprenyl glycosylphosphotransferase [Henriciella sp.]|uniref:exopolysaccharide biosynthesis polyprenyl glycosylphosphotransferase n=1 Tax=Henriciella sp. TaxID=1968823 RepID=UPI003C76A235